MKFKQILCSLLNIVVFIILLIFSYFVFRTIVTLDLAVSSIAFLERTEFELMLINIRKIIAIILSFFFTCVVDFKFIKRILVKLKIDKFNKIIFITFVSITALLFIGLLVFCKVYSL